MVMKGEARTNSLCYFFKFLLGLQIWDSSWVTQLPFLVWNPDFEFEVQILNPSSRDPKPERKIEVNTAY